MWNVSATFENGDAVPLRVSVREREHVALISLVPEARDLAAQYQTAVPWHLVEAAAVPIPSAWNDPIPLWAKRLDGQQDGVSISRTRESGDELAILWQGGDVQTWHEPTTVVIAVPTGVESLDVAYRWDDPEALQNVEWDDFWPQSGELWPTFEGRLFVGARSAIFDFEQQADLIGFGDSPNTLHWTLKAKHLSGLLIGRIVRRFSRKGERLFAADPAFRDRLASEERRDQTTALQCPRIEDARVRRRRAEAIVVVHGTFSCSVEAAEVIRGTRLTADVYRYEHDTFLPVGVNAEELASHLLRLFGARQTRVLLVGHSRGGLVACQAAAMLRHSTTKSNLRVLTLGTPHFGTPLLGMNRRFIRTLGALYRLSARLRDGATSVTDLEGAVSYLVATGEPPPGVSCMCEDSDFLHLHRAHAGALHARTVGGRCDVAQTTDGHGIFFGGFLQQFFDGEDNDLVVPTRSAILDGSSPVDDCNHAQYLLRGALSQLLDQQLSKP